LVRFLFSLELPLEKTESLGAALEAAGICTRLQWSGIYSSHYSANISALQARFFVKNTAAILEAYNYAGRLAVFCADGCPVSSV